MIVEICKIIAKYENSTDAREQMAVTILNTLVAALALKRGSLMSALFAVTHGLAVGAMNELEGIKQATSAKQN